MCPLWLPRRESRAAQMAPIYTLTVFQPALPRSSDQVFRSSGLVFRGLPGLPRSSDQVFRSSG